MVSGFLVLVAVDAADTPYVGVLALFDHDTIADNQVVLIGIDTLNRALLQHYGLAGLLSKYDTPTKHHRAGYQR